MAHTSPALTIPFTVGTSKIVGQGNLPIVRCRISFSSVNATPTWTEVPQAKFLAFSISRGRENELTGFDAGNATITLDDRDGTYDAFRNSAVKPMNRIWLYEEFTGEIHSLFKGYVESWGLEWPQGDFASGTTAVVSAVDEFKNLAMQTVPTTSPPRSGYADVVASDNPTGYWRLNEDPATQVQEPAQPIPPNPLIYDLSDEGIRWRWIFGRRHRR